MAMMMRKATPYRAAPPTAGSMASGMFDRTGGFMAMGGYCPSPPQPI
jgi:hypothetical protein